MKKINILLILPLVLILVSACGLVQNAQTPITPIDQSSVPTSTTILQVESSTPTIDLASITIPEGLIASSSSKKKAATSSSEKKVSTPTSTPKVITPSTPEVKTINISNFTFNPSSLTIKKGTMVTWTNSDSVPHQIKSDIFNSSVLSQGQSFTFTFNTLGTFDYICSIHPSMTGQIIVE